MLQRNPKLGRNDIGDPAMDGVAPYYDSAVNEVARLRSTHAYRVPDRQLYPELTGDFDDSDIQAGIARSLSDHYQVEDGQLEFGSSRPRGVVDIFRAVACSLAGHGDGGHVMPALR